MTQKEILDFAKRQREEMGANDKRRDEGLAIPGEIKCLFDIRYSKSAETCLLDIYRPRRSAKSLPTIVSIHGGGWVYGDKELYSFYCMELAKRGFAVVNFTYRLAPEHKFPAALEDTNDVFKWILDNSPEYKLDAQNIFATGDSAGANYLATYAAICANEDFAKEFHFDIPAKLRLNALYLNCGMYDFVSLSKTSDIKATGGALFKNGGTKKELILASPIFHIERNFPSALLVTAEDDFLREQVPPFAQRLCEKQAGFEYKCYRTQEPHSYKTKEPKLGHVFMLDLRGKYSASCLDEQCDFFRRHLRREAS